MRSICIHWHCSCSREEDEENYFKNVNHKNIFQFPQLVEHFPNRRIQCVEEKKEMKNVRRAELCIQKWLGMNLIAASAIYQHQMNLKRWKIFAAKYRKEKFMNDIVVARALLIWSCGTLCLWIQCAGKREKFEVKDRLLNCIDIRKYVLFF